MARSPHAKTLLVLRHAHAEAGSPDGTDFSRPLTPDGHKEAKRVGKYLRKEEIGVDAVVCSAAVRTRQTAEGALESAKLKVAVKTEHALFGASAEEILALLRGTGEKAARLLIVGHNPGVADLVGLLSSRESSLTVHFPPATLACLEFEGDWQSLAPSAATLRWIVPVKLMG